MVLEEELAWVSGLGYILIPKISIQNHGPSIFGRNNYFEELEERLKLLVLSVVIEGHNRDGILGLQDVTVGRVVHQNHVFQSAVHHPQVLQVVPLLQCAVLSEQPVRNQLLLRVDVVQNYVRVRRTARREDDDLSELR
jgi:hypothetical protein